MREREEERDRYRDRDREFAHVCVCVFKKRHNETTPVVVVVDYLANFNTQFICFAFSHAYSLFSASSRILTCVLQRS